MLVDPFFGGQVLTPDEAVERVNMVVGKSLVSDASELRQATHTEWIRRLLRNLQVIFAAQKRDDDLAAMNELQALLDESLF